MPDGTSTLIDMIWSGAKYVWALLLGILMWNGKRLVKRVDEIDKESVRKDDFNRTLSSLRGDIQKLGESNVDTAKTLRSDLRDDLKGVHSRIDNLLSKD